MNKQIGQMTRHGPGAALGFLLTCLLAASGAAVAQQPGTAAPPAAASQAPRGGSSSIDAVLAKSNADEFLPPDVAFRLGVLPDGPDRVRLVWQIADGYYLYRARIKAETGSDRAQLGQLGMPTGQTKTDDYFGKQEVYHRELVATLPVARAGGAALELPLKVTYQGCADKGLCYPPITKTLNVSLPAGGAAAGATPGVAVPSDGAASAGFVSEQDRYASVIRDSNIAWVILFFLIAGVGLSFTPCVLPMVPIVSGIIIGDGRNVTVKRSFTLALIYVLGMASTYTAAGIAVAAGGEHVQAAFQQPWIIAVFAAVFIVLALSMFGLFTLQMPAAIQTRLASVSNRQSAGTYGGVAVMGALSALIVTTCVAPALVGALLFIGQSGNMVRGGLALFAMGLGMGTPLLVVGASAGKLLPRAGAWMDLVKRLFGALMLAVAAWMLQRIVPERFTMLLWIVPTAAAAAVLWSGARSLRRSLIPIRILGGACAAYAVILIVGGLLGSTDPLSPIPGRAVSGTSLAFRNIKSVDDLQREVADARTHGKGVLLDFYADWCVSCKEMERYTFTDTAVQSALNGTILLRADVTGNDDADKALLQHFGIFGPPTIALYGADGQERRNFRVVGYMKATDFAALLHQALVSQDTAGKRATAQASASLIAPAT